MVHRTVELPQRKVKEQKRQELHSLDHLKLPCISFTLLMIIVD